MFLQVYKSLLDFNFNHLICDTLPFPGKNSPNIAKSNRAFPGKEGRDRALILTYLDSPMAEVFPYCCLSFSISAIIRGKRVVKVGPKVKTLGPSLFHENSNPSSFFQTIFLFARVRHLVRISAILHLIRGSSAQKPLKKGYFMNPESVCKTLKTFDLKITNAILMKLTTIMYLHESVNQKPFGAKNSVFWCNVYEFLGYIKNRHICHALLCIASW